MSLHRIDLFNNQSFIDFVDFAAMGHREGMHKGDWAVVDGARVSFGRSVADFPFERNVKLASDLWDNADMSPFSHDVIQTNNSLPIFIALKIFLFAFAEYSEISGRYTQAVSDEDKCFIPFDFPKDYIDVLRSEFQKSKRMYSSLYDGEKFKQGHKQVAKELARSTLLYSFSTDFRMTITLRKLAHFIMRFANDSDLGDINKAYFELISEHAPIFAKNFEPWWRRAATEKTPLGDSNSIHFNGVDLGILDDPYSALQFRKADGSDSEFADIVRESRGYSGSDESVIRSLVKGCRRDDLPEELSEIALRFALRCPIYIFRQMYRHKRAVWYGFKECFDMFYVPSEWRAQTSASRYIFSPFSEAENKDLTARFSDYIEESKQFFQSLLLQGLPLRYAKRFLRYCFYVQTLRRSDGIELFNFFNLRCDFHAQKEHQRYAISMLKVFASHFPIIFKIWYEEYFTGKTDERNSEVKKIYDANR